MNLEKINEILNSIKISLNDSHSYSRIFTSLVKEQKKGLSKEFDDYKKFCIEEYHALSRRIDKSGIQEGVSVRNVLKTRRLSTFLINDKGELNLAILPNVIQFLTQHLYSLGPERHHDAIRQEHILKVLKLLQENKELLQLFKSISKPFSHQFADQVIRDTLTLPENTSITDAHTRRAVLSAWLCYLRQNVGSCFATAPAILVHGEQPAQFLKDINEILSTGRLRRTYEGAEYSVPLSTSWGSGDLKRIILLSKTFVEERPIWLSPGILEAFEASGLISTKLSLKERLKENKNLITNYLKSLPGTYPFVTISIEELLKGIILNHLGIHEQDLEDFLNRPQNMIQGNLMMSTPHSRIGGKGEACSTFFYLFGKAQNAFKALADNALLKSWEFTLASFAEVKSGFTRWNLYSSLGLGSNEKGGIGECLYNIIKEKLDNENEKIKSIQFEYEQVYANIKYLEARIRNASEQEIQWLKAEYQSRTNQFRSLEEMREQMSFKASRLANLFSDLIKIYDELFPLYFQEIYDADMHDVALGPYDDSPAGFRLIFKHGRRNTAQWTRIYSPHDFVDALVNFFTITEYEIAFSDLIQGLETVFSEIVTEVVNHLKTKEFLETAFHRMAKAHHVPVIKNPLENLDKIEKKPWVYTSGGTMETLVSCYYRRLQKPSELSRWVESPLELLVFLVDTVKQIPSKVMEEYIINPNKSMLMSSPTHAFLFKPGLKPFRDLWNTDAFTYTWVRDQIVIPMQRFIEEISLDVDMMHFLIQEIQKKIPKNYQHYFQKSFSHLYGVMNPIEFREHIANKSFQDRGFRFAGKSIFSLDELDHSLYSLLPLFPKHELEEKVKNIFSLLPEYSLDKESTLAEILTTIKKNIFNSQFISAQTLLNICKILVSLLIGKISSNVNYHQQIIQIGRQLGYMMPTPIIFADTNWVKDYFAFLVNPGTGCFELWRIDQNGFTGYPMTIWEQWLNGSRKDISWGVYTNPYEYT